MAADNSSACEQAQDIQLDLGENQQNIDNNLIGNGNPQATDVNLKIMRELGSPCGSTTETLLSQINFSKSFSISSTPRDALLLDDLQLHSQNSEESTESSTPQSSPPRIEKTQIVAVENDQIDQFGFMLRSNQQSLLRNETMINITTDVNAPNMMRVEVEAPSFSTVVTESPQTYSPRQAEMVLQSRPISQSHTFYSNHLGLNIHNNMTNTFVDQYALFYQPPYSQSTMGIMDQRSSWNNHQQPWFSFSYNTRPHRPISTTPFGLTYNQFLRANIFGSSSSSSFLSNGPSLQSRPMQPAIWHQVPQLSNTYDPYSHTHSMAPIPPAYPRFQGFSYPNSHQAYMAPNLYDTQGWNLMQSPDPSFQMRPQNFGRRQVQYGMNPHNYNSVLPGPSMPPSFQQFNGNNQHMNGLPNVSEPQNSTNPRQEPLLLTGSPQATDIQQEMMTYVSQNQQQHNSTVPEAPTVSSFRSEQLMDRGHVNGSINGAMPQIADQLQDNSIVPPMPWLSQFDELSKEEQEQVMILEIPPEGENGEESRRRNRFEFGESSSSPSKRIRRESTPPETCPLPVNPQGDGASTSSAAEERTDFAHPRQIKSEIYDPMFQEVGLPVDPHLRMFLMS